MSVDLRNVEARHSVVIGAFLHAVDGSITRSHRPDLRLPFCSTFKPLLGGTVLDQVEAGTLALDERLPIEAADLQVHSPITEAYVGSSLSLAELVGASVTESDNTAANLLLALVGGPRVVTSFARRLGDDVFLLTDDEPGLSDVERGAVANTTSARAMVGSYERMLRGAGGLTRASRELLLTAMARNEFGSERITAGASGWDVVHKTGTGSRGEANDVAILNRPGHPELMMAVFTRANDPEAEPSDAAVAAATEVMLRGR